MNPQQEIDRLKAALEAERKKQTSFARTVSHSLKNSLGLVNSFASMALRDRDSLDEAEMIDILETIARNGRMALYITDQLRFWGRIKNGAQLKIESCQLAQVLDRIIQHSEDLIHFSQAKIDQTVIDLVVQGDRNALEEALLNPLTFLLRFGERPNHITIDGQKKRQKIELVMTGRYEQEIELDKLFTQDPHKLVQADGYGLGLPFARELLAMIGGTIHYEQTGANLLSFHLSLLPFEPTNLVDG